MCRHMQTTCLYMFVSFCFILYHFVLLLQPIDSLQRFQFDFGGCCFGFSSCHPYPTSLILSQHCSSMLKFSQTYSTIVRTQSNTQIHAGSDSAYALESAAVCKSVQFAVISLPLRHALHCAPVLRTPFRVRKWCRQHHQPSETNGNLAKVISISAADVCAFSHHRCSPCGIGWSRKHLVWLF